MTESANLNTIPYNVQAAGIFRNAALYIRTYGWQRSGMGEHGKPRCSMGALASAHQEKIWEPGLAVLMYDALSIELNGIGLTQFNKLVPNGNDVAQLFERVAHFLGD
jgi:hypothetical protein